MLFAYGRFYAGGDIENDRDDMVAAMKFLEATSLVDKQHIGVMGTSWGGFEALYAGAFAPASVKPAAIVAISPLSDFSDEHAFVTVEVINRYATDTAKNLARSFFEPYLRRIDHTTRGTHYEGFRRADLVAGLTSPTFVLHEDWDTLVGYQQSTDLAAAAPGLVHLLSVRHSAPPVSWAEPELINSPGPLMNRGTRTPPS